MVDLPEEHEVQHCEVGARAFGILGGGRPRSKNPAPHLDPDKTAE